MAWDEAAERRAFIRRVKRRMLALGLTQADVAQGVGASRPTVSAALDLNHTAWLGGDKIIRLPEVLRCSHRWLFTNRGPEGPEQESENVQWKDGYLTCAADLQLSIEEHTARIRRRPR